MIHPIIRLAEKIGSLTNSFEPGTSFYEEVVEGTRSRIDQANTRDDIAATLVRLESKVETHLMDKDREAFKEAIDEIQEIEDPWPVDAFKEGFRKGTGQELRDTDHAAGRSMNNDRINT